MGVVARLGVGKGLGVEPSTPQRLGQTITGTGVRGVEFGGESQGAHGRGSLSACDGRYGKGVVCLGPFGEVRRERKEFLLGVGELALGHVDPCANEPGPTLAGIAGEDLVGHAFSGGVVFEHVGRFGAGKPDQQFIRLDLDQAVEGPAELFELGATGLFVARARRSQVMQRQAHSRQWRGIVRAHDGLAGLGQRLRVAPLDAQVHQFPGGPRARGVFGHYGQEGRDGKLGGLVGLGHGVGTGLTPNVGNELEPCLGGPVGVLGQSVADHTPGHGDRPVVSTQSLAEVQGALGVAGRGLQDDVVGLDKTLDHLFQHVDRGVGVPLAQLSVAGQCVASGQTHDRAHLGRLQQRRGTKRLAGVVVPAESQAGLPERVVPAPVRGGLGNVPLGHVGRSPVVLRPKCNRRLVKEPPARVLMHVQVDARTGASADDRKQNRNDDQFLHPSTSFLPDAPPGRARRTGVHATPIPLTGQCGYRHKTDLTSVAFVRTGRGAVEKSGMGILPMHGTAILAV